MKNIILIILILTLMFLGWVIISMIIEAVDIYHDCEKTTLVTASGQSIFECGGKE